MRRCFRALLARTLAQHIQAVVAGAHARTVVVAAQKSLVALVLAHGAIAQRAAVGTVVIDGALRAFAHVDGGKLCAHIVRLAAARVAVFTQPIVAALAHAPVAAATRLARTHVASAARVRIIALALKAPGHGAMHTRKLIRHRVRQRQQQRAKAQGQNDKDANFAPAHRK